jgi:hypothetical protein
VEFTQFCLMPAEHSIGLLGAEVALGSQGERTKQHQGHKNTAHVPKLRSKSIINVM